LDSDGYVQEHIVRPAVFAVETSASFVDIDMNFHDGVSFLWKMMLDVHTFVSLR
jgi:hypothetical protein